MALLTFVEPLAGMVGMVSFFRWPHDGQVIVDSDIMIFLHLPEISQAATA